MRHRLVFCLVIGAILAGFPAARPAEPASGQHPLAPLLEAARQGLRRIQGEVRDYSCRLVKRERIDGRLMPREVMAVKVRHGQLNGDQPAVPFSVYLRFLSPDDLEGREVLYVDRQYEGKMIVRKGGRRLAGLTLAVSPDSPLALYGNRFPVTEIGIENLLARLVQLGETEIERPDCRIQEIQGVPVHGQKCTVVEIRHPLREEGLRYHFARVFVDPELQLPIGFESYDWSSAEGSEPSLLEEYVYLDLKLNVGLTDRDFDPANEAYRFRRPFGK